MAPPTEKLSGAEDMEFAQILSMPALQGIIISFTLLSVVLTVVRLVRSWRTSGRFHLDDVFSCTATFLVILYTAATLVDDQVQHEMSQYSRGLSSQIPSMERIDRTIKMEVACTFFMWLIIYLAKATLLALYWRTLCTRRAARTTWFSMAGVTALFLGIIFLSAFWICGMPTQIDSTEACQNMSVAAATRLLALWCTCNLIDFILLIVFPLARLLSSPPQSNKRQVSVTCALVLLALFFVTLDILRTYWGLSVHLIETTNLALVWKALEPIIAAILAATSGLADWCRPRDESYKPGDSRSWIEIEDVGKLPSG